MHKSVAFTHSVLRVPHTSGSRWILIITLSTNTLYIWNWSTQVIERQYQQALSVSVVHVVHALPEYTRASWVNWQRFSSRTLTGKDTTLQIRSSTRGEGIIRQYLTQHRLYAILSSLLWSWSLHTAISLENTTCRFEERWLAPRLTLQPWHLTSFT